MEQTQIIKGLNINYNETGAGKPVVLLHGWGSNLQAFTRIQENLESSFHVISVDLPGFGKSQEPNEVWGVYEYTEFIEEFLSVKNISNPILAGHSYGGRISIVYSSRNPVHKLILLDSAGIKPTRPLSYYIRVYTYKFVRAVLPYLVGRAKANEIIENYRKQAGSSDYKSASPVMRQVLVKSVNEDLKVEMPKIKAPTLLVWGENDTATPVSDAKTMEKLIPNAGLVVLRNAGHFAFVEKLGEFLIILNNFLEPDKKNG
ncbi:alpha/beta fold hydrolase [Mucilaginibacter sp. L3T2-6]|uniref:alpha/beta fold hydrolase n=1 Tax=Mucilaginibacter sp. L3T2-6 TaxID=3062491 RepID=UPI0026765A8C|nr:alpha/beta hydrolase [Mucilaginibacter sp. L3T2-6]MDO3644764.1 alpha/beta hydrolase [Mucilaginibacter sp. L3T2-6]MDV6217200.1 alpha/beta hydrolase [Mucilaginibacter sp. L3T2-6]